MSELATRARVVLEQLIHKVAYKEDSAAGVIEQALLAERRLALEEAYEAVRSQQEHCKECADSNILYASMQRLDQLKRAAAEKEVGK